MRPAGLLAVLALAGCGREPAVIDGSSPDNFTRTAEAARRDLSVRDRLAFDRALRHPPGKRLADSEQEAAEMARETYGGMTAAEVVASAGERAQR